MRKRDRGLFWSGVAAIVGGLLYAVKAGVILLGGDQPAYLFEAAPIAFGTSLLLVGWTWPGSLTRAARILAVVIVVAGAANVAEDALIGEEPVPALSSLVDAITGFGPVVALLLLGLALRRSNDPAPPGAMPLLAMAALYPLAFLSLGPLSLVVDIDSPSGERWIEVSILAIGLGWIWLGAKGAVTFSLGLRNATLRTTACQSRSSVIAVAETPPVTTPSAHD